MFIKIAHLPLRQCTTNRGRKTSSRNEAEGDPLWASSEPPALVKNRRPWKKSDLSRSSRRLHLRPNRNSKVFIPTLYVDDLLVFRDNLRVIETIRRKSMDTFEMMDMGDVSLVLVAQVKRDLEKEKRIVDQENYV